MAKNKPIGDNRRYGQITGRSQTYNEKINRFIKRDTSTGRFIDQKTNGKPFKGVKKER